jgi:hypothetical protein
VIWGGGHSLALQLAISVNECLTKGFGLEHDPIRWNRLSDQDMRQFKSLSMILPQKWIPLLRIVL